MHQERRRRIRDAHSTVKECASYEECASLMHRSFLPSCIPDAGLLRLVICGGGRRFLKRAVVPPYGQELIGSVLAGLN